MHILHIIDSLAKGGAEVLLINCIKEFKRTFPESTHVIVTLKKEGDLQLVNEAKVLGTFVSLNLNKCNFLAKVQQFKKLLSKERIDIIHSHLLDSTLFARLAKPTKVRLVSTYHNIVYDKQQVHYSSWRRFLDKVTYKEAYYSIFVSKAVADNIVTAIPIKRNYTILVNFAGQEFKYSYKFNPEKRLKLISVGNLKPNKNHEIAIKALAKLKHLPIELDIYGDGALRTYLQELINETEAKVYLKGISKISPELLSGYDAFLMTSLNEGMPIALIEALMCGIPPILNDLPMLRETADSAALYYETNTLESLISHLKGVYDHKNELKRLSNETIRICNRYSATSYVYSLEQVYKS